MKEADGRRAFSLQPETASGLRKEKISHPSARIGLARSRRLWFVMARTCHPSTRSSPSRESPVTHDAEAPGSGLRPPGCKADRASIVWHCVPLEGIANPSGGRAEEASKIAIVHEGIAIPSRGTRRGSEPIAIIHEGIAIPSRGTRRATKETGVPLEQPPRQPARDGVPPVADWPARPRAIRPFTWAPTDVYVKRNRQGRQEPAGFPEETLSPEGTRLLAPLASWRFLSRPRRLRSRPNGIVL